MILVGAHSLVPYNPWINKGFWAHGSAPLPSKRTVGPAVSDSAPEVPPTIRSVPPDQKLRQREGARQCAPCKWAAGVMPQ